MPRQRFFPRLQAEQSMWLAAFADNLVPIGPTLGLTPAELNAALADALYLHYCYGTWAAAAKSFAKAGTAAVRTAGQGTDEGVHAFPVFTAPPLPAARGALPAVVPVPAGALKRIMRLIAALKLRPAYTPALGKQLGIVGAAEAAPELMPEFTVTPELGVQGPEAQVDFKKSGRIAVAIFSRRGVGDWEQVGVATASPFRDRRALLVAGQPEAREYRLRFYEGDAATGEYTAVARVVVG